MSLFDTPNVEMYHGMTADASPGPRLGFQDALQASWDMQTKVDGLFAIEKAFATADQAQTRKLRDAGLEPPGDATMLQADATGRTRNFYMAAARVLAGDTAPDVDGLVDADFGMVEELKRRDEHIDRLKKLHPQLGLQTYGEMFKAMQDTAVEAKKRDAQDKTWGGVAGSFVGGMGGAVDPISNPLNFATMPLGMGKTIAARIATQAGFQGLVEAADIGLNPDTHRLLLGKDPTLGELGVRVGMAAVGGAAGQAVGEVAGAGARAVGRRWFADAPLPALEPRPAAAPSRPVEFQGEVPPPVPANRPITEYPTWEQFREAHAAELDVNRVYGQSREASAREANDIFYVGQQLDRWDGPHPNAIPARTDVALPPSVEPGVRFNKPYTNYVNAMETTHDIARRLDPGLFRTYDALAGQRAELAAAIERGRTLGDLRPNANRPDIKAAFEAERTARELTQREQMLALDEKMRDLAPLVSRAYGAAEKEWRAAPVDFETLAFLKRLEEGTGWRYRGEGKASLTEQPLRAPREPAPVIEPERKLRITAVEAGIERLKIVKKEASTPHVAADADRRSVDLKTELTRLINEASSNPTPAPPTVHDAVPLARLSPEQAKRAGPGADATERVHIATVDAIAAIEAKIEKFMKTARQDIVAPPKPAVADAPRLFEPTPKKPLTAHEDRIVERIIGAFLDETGGKAKEYVNLDVIRARLSDLDRKTVDEGLLAIIQGRKPGLGIGAWSDMKAVTPAMHAAAFNPSGVEPKHLLNMRPELAMQYVTMPDGSRLHLDRDVISTPDGDKTVRDFLREMDKDQHALQSVVTCSVPS